MKTPSKHDLQMTIFALNDQCVDLIRANDYLTAALNAIVHITDSSQPIDYPGALMVARAALRVQS